MPTLLILHCAKHCPSPLSFSLFWAASSFLASQKALLTGSSTSLCCSTSTWPRPLFNNSFNHCLLTLGHFNMIAYLRPQSRSNHCIVGKCHLIVNRKSWRPYPPPCRNSFLIPSEKDNIYSSLSNCYPVFFYCEFSHPDIFSCSPYYCCFFVSNKSPQNSELNNKFCLLL